MLSTKLVDTELHQEAILCEPSCRVIQDSKGVQVEIIIRRKFTYESNIKVSSVATGFLCPISLANIIDFSLMITIKVMRRLYTKEMLDQSMHFC